MHPYACAEVRCVKRHQELPPYCDGVGLASR